MKTAIRKLPVTSRTLAYERGGTPIEIKGEGAMNYEHGGREMR
jgi:hypothetical protein